MPPVGEVVSAEPGTAGALWRSRNSAADGPNWVRHVLTAPNDVRVARSALFLAAVVFGACDQFTGMGWMQSASCAHATFPAPPAVTPVEDLFTLIVFSPPPPVLPCDARATFGFVIDPTTNNDIGRFHGTYSDPSFTGVLGDVPATVNGVKLRGDGVFAAQTVGSPSPRVVRCIAGILNYQSGDPMVTGSGRLQLVACDLDEPGINQDGLYIHVISGPYAGYVNFGLVQGGNLQ